MPKKTAPVATTKPAVLVQAHARGLHVSPRKMRLVTNMVKNMYVGDALTQLAHANKKAAPMVIKLINSAIANAGHNYSLQPETLYIKTITCDMGTTMKRYFPRARGSAFVIRRKMCHVNITLEEKKRGKVATSRNMFIKRSVKPSKDQAPSADQLDATNTKLEKVEPKKSQIFKSDEQVKMNKAANKRRLFNRKSGE